MRARRYAAWVGVFVGLQVVLIGASDQLPFRVSRLAVALPASADPAFGAPGVPLSQAAGAPLRTLPTTAADPATAAEPGMLSRVGDGVAGALPTSRSGRPASTPDPAQAPVAPGVPGAPLPQPVPVPSAYGEPVRLAFAGDVHFAGFLGPALDADPAGLLAPLGDLVGGADIAVVNLETAIVSADHPPAAKQFTFGAPPLALTALAGAGVDVLAAANNHTVDYGEGGLADTLAAERATGVPLIGVGADEDEAYAPWVADVRNRRVGVISATQVLDDELIWDWKAGPDRAGVASAKHQQRLIRAVQAARRQVDTLVVYLHWGVEGASCPSADQRVLAEQLVAAGADIIVGTHAHTPQGAGRLGSAVVAYGLGNAVFYTGGEAGVLEVVADGRDILEYRWIPVTLLNGVATRLSGPAADAARAQHDTLRACAALEP
jgi:poly-gamma-glutamate synthesis protein (capsule biosynthesis protein)